MAENTPLLVKQLCFARKEFMRCLEGLKPEDAQKRMGQMNSISWIIGHLGCQEQRYWVETQGKEGLPALDACSWGEPASTPSLDTVLEAWHEITQLADQYLDTVTTEDLATHLTHNGETVRENVGTRLMRNMMHYWFHLGEAHAIRQIMGHKDLPQFVGNMETCTYEARD